MRIGQRVGIPLAEIAAVLATLPNGRTPTRREWQELSGRWQARLDARIRDLQHLRDDFGDCIGCGCLSLDRCPLANPADELGTQGPGPRRLLGAPRSSASCASRTASCAFRPGEFRVPPRRVARSTAQVPSFGRASCAFRRARSPASCRSLATHLRALARGPGERAADSARSTSAMTAGSVGSARAAPRPRAHRLDRTSTAPRAGAVRAA